MSENLFPHLHISLLIAHAKRWLKKYSEAPIERVLLYNFSFPFRGEVAKLEGPNFKAFHHIYAIVFEVDAVNKTLEMSPSDLVAYDRRVMAAKHPETFDPRKKEDSERMEKIRSENSDIEWAVQLFRSNDKEMMQMSAPYPDSYSRLLADTEPNLRKPHEQRYQHFIDENFREVYRHPVTDMDSHRKDWVFRVKFKNTELSANIVEPFLSLVSNQLDSDIGEKASAPVDVRDIVIELENEDQVKIRAPGKPKKMETLENLGFKNSTTTEAGALKTLLEHRKFNRKGGSGGKLIQRINKKLQNYFDGLGISFKPNAKFISLKASGTGHYIPNFKTMVPEFRNKNDFEKKLNWAKRECGKDKQVEIINQALVDEVILKEEATRYSEALEDDLSETILDRGELTKKGGSHIEYPRKK